MPVVDKKARKDRVWNNLVTAVNKYKKCVFVNCDNVTSKQICIMRKALRDIDAHMVMGKNVSRFILSDTTFCVDPHEDLH